jgi:hypothetical protein
MAVTVSPLGALSVTETVPVTAPLPLLVTVTVYCAPVWPCIKLPVWVFVIVRSGCDVIVSVSVALLFPGVGSLVPDGVAILATFTMLPEAPAVPVTLKVTLPPLGSVGITIPVPCINATVVLPTAGHAALPVADPHVTPVTVRLLTAGSVKTAPLAPEGPPLLTTIV